MSEVMLKTRDSLEPHLTGSVPDVRAARPVVDFITAINRGDVEGAIAYLAPDALQSGGVSHYRPTGVRVMFSLLREILPDLRLDIRELRVEGTTVISRVAFSGTHTGSYLGKPPTGRPIVWETTDVAEVGPVTAVREDPAPADEVELGQGADSDSGYWKVLRRYWEIINDPDLWKELGVKPAIMC